MKKYYPDEIIEEVRNSSEIVEIISEYVHLKRSGRNFFGVCPFHNEKTPSFSVSQDKQIFHCFGCSAGGNVITFLMKIENISFTEAVQMLATRARITLPEEDVSEEIRAKNHLKEQLINANTEAARYFYQNLLSTSTAQNYLKRRGLDAHTIKKFGIGYSLDEWDSLNKYLLYKGFNQEVIFKAGLVKHAKNERFVDTFRGRIMFPIFDTSSKIIGFGGRSLGDGHPKYLNTSDTLVFNKSNNLFCLNIAKTSASRKAILVEGYMDAIALHQHGIDYAVACLGTALTDSQARLLRKYTDEVIVAYDADTAGQAATLRGIEILNSAGCSIRILTIPDGKDPDEYIRKHGVDKLLSLIKHSSTYMQYKINNLKSQYDLSAIDGKIKFLNKVSFNLSKIENNIERDAYINLLSKETGISAESIAAQVNKHLYSSDKPKIASKKTDNIDKPIAVLDKQLDEAEKLLIFLLCREGMYSNFKDKVSIDLFSYTVNKEIAENVIKKLISGKTIEPAELMIELDEEDKVKAISKIFSVKPEFEDINKAIQECLNYLNEIKKKNRLLELLKQNKQLHDDETKLKEIDQLLRYNNLKPIKKGGTTSE